MSSPVERTVAGFRWVATLRGDNLQRLCARELGDATVWAEVAAFNRLKPPYITDDLALAGPFVLLSGQKLRLPAPVAIVSAELDPDAVFLVDILLIRGRLTVAPGGDLMPVAGAANLKQALSNRMDTERGELTMRPTYGSGIKRIVGATNGPTSALLGAEFARNSVAADPRISRVLKSVGKAIGDGVSVVVTAETVSGTVITAISGA